MVVVVRVGFVGCICGRVDIGVMVFVVCIGFCIIGVGVLIGVNDVVCIGFVMVVGSIGLVCILVMVLFVFLVFLFLFLFFVWMFFVFLWLW